MRAEIPVLRTFLFSSRLKFQIKVSNKFNFLQAIFSTVENSQGIFLNNFNMTKAKYSEKSSLDKKHDFKDEFVNFNFKINSLFGFEKTTIRKLIK